MITKRTIATKSNKAPPMSSEAVLDKAEHRETIHWWRILSSIAIFNISVWFYTLANYWKNAHEHDSYSYSYSHSYNSLSHQHQRRHLHVVLSGIYVFVCAYRSFLPRIDLERYCLFDTQYSSIFLGRSAATIAELSFSAQVALFLYDLGDKYQHPLSQTFPLFIVPSIALAQVFCWCGVLTLNHFYHAVEESIWAIMSGFISWSLLSLALHQSHNNELFMSAMIGSIASACFFAYMVTFDVPMYLRRWRDNGCVKLESSSSLLSSSHHKRMKLFEGGRDAWERRVVTKSWKVWREESVWLTCYFSGGVWVSLMMVHCQ